MKNSLSKVKFMFREEENGWRRMEKDGGNIETEYVYI